MKSKTEFNDICSIDTERPRQNLTFNYSYIKSDTSKVLITMRIRESLEAEWDTWDDDGNFVDKGDWILEFIVADMRNKTKEELAEAFIINGGLQYRRSHIFKLICTQDYYGLLSQKTFIDEKIHMIVEKYH